MLTIGFQILSVAAVGLVVMIVIELSDIRLALRRIADALEKRDK